MTTDTLEPTAQGGSSVRAKINYSVPMGRRPSFSLPPVGNDLSLAPTEVSIRRADALEAAPRLDREGFACVPHKADLTDLAQSEALQALYRERLRAFMRELTGADEIILVPYLVFRHQIPTRQDQAPAVDVVHSDFTHLGADQVLPDYGSPSLSSVRRTAMFNMWRLLSPGPTDRPLALCDARSVEEHDLIVGESRYPHLTFETVFVNANPRHRWVYFPQLTTDELLVFKQAESDPTLPRFVPHTAFEDHSCAPDPVPRVSVEARCLAIWKS